MPHSFFKTTARATGRSLPKLLLGLLMLLILPLALQACGNGDGDRPGPTNCEELEKTGIGEPVSQDLNQLACDNGNFASDLYRSLSDEEGNLFFSPFSISQVLAMAYAGARGETERQMAGTLRYGLPQNRLHPAFNAIDRALHSRGDAPSSSTGSDGENSGFRLNIANAVWGQEGFEFRRQFLDILAENYGGELRPLDFASEPEESRVRINDWIDEKTEGKIKNLFPQGTIDWLTRLVLTNAIYFNASWRSPFDPEATMERPFRLLDGGQVEVPMMTDNFDYVSVQYAQGDGLQAVAIPYETNGMSMIALLPDDGKFEDFEDSLSAGILDQVEWEDRDVTLKMPRFEYSYTSLLRKTMKKWGCPTPSTKKPTLPA